MVTIFRLSPTGLPAGRANSRRGKMLPNLPKRLLLAWSRLSPRIGCLCQWTLELHLPLSWGLQRKRNDLRRYFDRKHETINIFDLFLSIFSFTDHNECEQLGGQGGHFCTQAHSICVNTFGSYRCKLMGLGMTFFKIRKHRLLPREGAYLNGSSACHISSSGTWDFFLVLLQRTLEITRRIPGLWTTNGSWKAPSKGLKNA